MAVLARNEELRALIALRTAIGLKAMGCGFHRGLTSGVCITFNGRAVGAWTFEGPSFQFAQMTHGRVERSANSVEEVVAMTANVIALQPPPSSATRHFRDGIGPN